MQLKTIPNRKQFILSYHISAFSKQQGINLPAIPEKIDNNDSELRFKSQTASGTILALPLMRSWLWTNFLTVCGSVSFSFNMDIIVLTLKSDYEDQTKRESM